MAWIEFGKKMQETFRVAVGPKVAVLRFTGPIVGRSQGAGQVSASMVDAQVRSATLLLWNEGIGCGEECGGHGVVLRAAATRNKACGHRRHHGGH